MISPGADAVPMRKIILVVEDEVLIRFVISEYLRDVGFQVVEAGSADEALEYLGTLNEVALVFSDVRMPGSLDGIELSQRVRLLYPYLPMILASGHLLAG